MSDEEAKRRLTGLAVSPGVAVASAYCLYAIPAIPSTDRIDEARVMSELTALEEALQLTVAELKDLQARVQSQIGVDESAIFRSQISIVRDATLLDKLSRLISEQRCSATTALQAVRADYEQLFLQVEDDFLRERFADLRDALRRLEGHLANTKSQAASAPGGPVILVANELLPSDVVAVSGEQVVGIVTQSGGRTSHAAILARSYGIPAVAGVDGLLSLVTTGDLLIVDGTSGKVIVNPGEEAVYAYRKLGREYARLKRSLVAKSVGPAKTTDGQRLHLFANIGCAADAAEARRVGADGIGLYRTEFFFLTRAGLPTEDEQLAAYREVIESSPAGPVTIRTLDLGGDKTIPYLTHAPEANPFMGWRSIRLSFEHPQVFSVQIRAVLRAAHETGKQVRILFPMITTWGELKRVHEFLAAAREDLRREALPFGDLQVGMMLEVPAAAITLDQLLELVDFVSVGSNDLVQYLTAADRDNPRVSHLCQALCPAVLRVLRQVVRDCRAADKSLTVCGEMAGSPRAFPLLLGMGLRNFSMSPSFVPVIHDLAAHVSVAESEAILETVMQLNTSEQIQEVMDEFVRRVCPDVAPLLIA